MFIYLFLVTVAAAAFVFAGTARARVGAEVRRVPLEFPSAVKAAPARVFLAHLIKP